MIGLKNNELVFSKLPSRKNQQSCHQEDQSEDDKQRVTCSPPFSIVEHLSRLGEEEAAVSCQM